ncbi:HAD family hydrolase [Roseibium suaedae]|uniref:Putative hydrolase of the HAD superfamily n=1 Tax=Roseibium suaedae TaxID=735517 RepID=A0A1M7A8G7_9HYPH|nr:hypothetical protein [Roseibium suaedae]SHL38896.1 putative hydrolase of the HAD superfamily [Roseibium suaedae]
MTSPTRLSSHLEDLRATAQAGSHADLARLHMPVIMLDEAEPYPPLAMGYTVFEDAGQSPSSKFQVVPQGGAMGGPVIEYAIWYDWDIQHMYDLEHVWVYLDAGGQPVRVDASRHGNRITMEARDGRFQSRENRAVVYSEAGKHAHWADGDEMRREAGAYLPAMCGDLAAFEGVHLGNQYCESGKVTPKATDHRLAKLQMKADAFRPTYRFYPANDELIALVPWPALDTWIPDRVKHLMEDLRHRMPQIRTIFIDGTEDGGASLISGPALVPGVRGMLQRLRGAGYWIVLLGDESAASAAGLLKAAGLQDFFDEHRQIGASPFAFEAADLGGHAGSSALLLGGTQDTVKSARALGLHTAELVWTRNVPSVPSDAAPEHRFETPIDFLTLLKSLEEQMAGTARTQVAVRSA